MMSVSVAWIQKNRCRTDRCALRGGVLIGLLLLVFFRANRVIENDQARGPDLFSDEFGSLAVEPLTDRAIIVPLLKQRAKITQRKPLAIQRKQGCTTPPIVNRDFARVIAGSAGLGAMRRLVE